MSDESQRFSGSITDADLCRERDLDLLLLDLERDRECFFLLSLSAAKPLDTHSFIHSCIHVLAKCLNSPEDCREGEETSELAGGGIVQQRQPSRVPFHLLPGSMAAEMRDWASLTRFIASSISLLAASAFMLAFIFMLTAMGLSLDMQRLGSVRRR